MSVKKWISEQAAALPRLIGRMIKLAVGVATMNPRTIREAYGAMKKGEEEDNDETSL